MASAGMGKPHWLKHPTRTNFDVPPDKWALSCTQLFQFLTTCSREPQWGAIIAEQGYVSAYNVNEDFVIPWTRGTGAGVALNINSENPLAAELMISHAWKEDIVEFQEALQTYVQRSSLPMSTPVWFCLLALYQAGEVDNNVRGPQIQEQLEQDPFGCIIRRVNKHHGVVVVHTTQAEVYERLWCVYEMAEAVRMKSPTHAAFSDAYVKANTISVLDVVRVHTKQAQCTREGDRLMIRKKVKKVGGFKQLDARIFSFRLQALVELFALKHTAMDVNQFEQEIVEAEQELKQMQQVINRRKCRIGCMAVLFAGLLIGSSIWAVSALLGDESLAYLFSDRSEGDNTRDGYTVDSSTPTTSSSTFQPGGEQVTLPPDELEVLGGTVDKAHASHAQIAAVVVCIVAVLFSLVLCLVAGIRRACCLGSSFDSDESAISDLQQRLQLARRYLHQES